LAAIDRILFECPATTKNTRAVLDGAQVRATIGRSIPFGMQNRRFGPYLAAINRSLRAGVCRDWQDAPAIVYFNPWPDNVYHYFSDAIQPVFPTLESEGLLDHFELQRGWQVQGFLGFRVFLGLRHPLCPEL
jgi:hypothetical protein